MTDVLIIGSGPAGLSAAIYARGAEHKKLSAKGESEFAGRGISYCALCDGAFFSDQDVAVVGGDCRGGWRQRSHVSGGVYKNPSGIEECALAHSRAERFLFYRTNFPIKQKIACLRAILTMCWICLD